MEEERQAAQNEPGDTEWRTVAVDSGQTEAVLVDPVHGPFVYQVDGSASFLVHASALPQLSDPFGDQQKRGGRDFASKLWYMQTPTEQEVTLQIAAKKNQRLREWKGNEVAAIEQDLEFAGTWLYGHEDWQRYLVSKVAGGKLCVEGRLPSGTRMMGMLRTEPGRAKQLMAVLEVTQAGRYRAIGTLRLRFASPGRLVFDFQEPGEAQRTPWTCASVGASTHPTWPASGRQAGLGQGKTHRRCSRRLRQPGVC
mmetsp:Transcript_143163/g.398979  ORF Transcript_143163/g.398979 Transcript_143163/m.398979 type:complete len:253 (+) Transcript_143163:60-818(+)